ncbi:hypothetical protein KP509_26G001800 [Ceratopteris richardii]|uniref:Uncharacterized protein n=1 Tax=Ceratopteris richardii TaxID=49495 RepID=A0A8T2RHV2_CERRI|nr:hypothetical protein KP509_26G001800 [Ceratopteris richardii]
MPHRQMRKHGKEDEGSRFSELKILHLLLFRKHNKEDDGKRRRRKQLESSESSSLGTTRQTTITVSYTSRIDKAKHGCPYWT